MRHRFRVSLWADDLDPTGEAPRGLCVKSVLSRRFRKTDLGSADVADYSSPATAQIRAIGTAAASWALLGRRRAGEERICSLQLRFDRGALARRRRRKLRARFVPFLFAVPTSMDFEGVQTSTHDDDPPSGIVTAAGVYRLRELLRLICDQRSK